MSDLMRLLTQAERLLTRRLAAVLAEHGCTLDSWRVIELLATGGGHPMTEIAERTFLPPPTLTKLMDQLVDDGIVYRRVDVMDRRRIRAYLTQRGLKRHRELLGRVESTVDDLGLGDASSLAMLLEATVQRLSGARAADAHPVPLRS